MSELESEKTAASAEVAEIDSDMDKAKSLSPALRLSTRATKVTTVSTNQFSYPHVLTAFTRVSLFLVALCIDAVGYTDVYDTV